MSHYKNDPYPFKTRFNSRCAKCDCSLPKGSNAYYWPSSRKVFCLSCGDGDYRSFLSAVQDEEWMDSQYGRY